MKIHAFTKTYQGRTVLQFPEGEFLPGRIYAVIGPNGSGKSTFASVVSGVISPDEHAPVSEETDVGYLPQRPYAFHMSVQKNLLLNGEGAKEEQKKRARYLLDSLSLMSLSSKNAASLSGGETARMALARQFMKKYRLVILDEPSASMDIRSTYQAEDLIRAYVKETDAVLFLITHSLKQAGRLADEILFLNEGILVERGPAGQVLTRPEDPAVKRFLEF